MFKFEISNPEETFEFKSRFLGKEDLDVIGGIVLSGVLSRTPERTGRLKGQIAMVRRGEYEREILNKTKYGNLISGFQHYGTEPHFISPNKRKALSWVSGGERFFSRGHMVSGITASYFFEIKDSEFNQIMAYLNSRNLIG